MKGTIEIEKNDKAAIFKAIGKLLDEQGFEVDRKDFTRPWGGFFVLKEENAPHFISTYFPDIDVDELIVGRRMSPKILIVAPQKRLSWQYHHRRSEVWRVVGGEVGVVRSQTDEQGPLEKLKTGDTVVLDKEMRHRLVGLDTFGLVAEIWLHTDAENPSDEDDIVRLQDDFGRGQNS